MAENRYASTTLVEVGEKENINRALLDLLAKINEINSLAVTREAVISAATIPPVGYVYTQGPDDMAPAELWPSATWDNVSSEEAGSFRRFEGGGSLSFGGGQQGDAFQGHRHSHNFRLAGSSAGNGMISGSTDNGAYAGAIQDPITDGTNGTPRIASETRPVNYTVRKWRRTA